ncbi:MAG: ferrous iron transport protein B, partial [Gammaproteobacteria bacterium]
DEVVEQAVAKLRPMLPDRIERINSHWLALKMLEGDDFALQYADEATRKEVDRLVHCIADRAGEDPDMLIADTRYSHAHAIAQQAQKEAGKLGKTLTDKIDKIVLSPVLGIPIFLFVMYLMFLFAINFGGAFVDFFDGAAQTIFVDGFGDLLTRIGTPDWLVVLLANGAGGGIQIVATFIPIIAGLYLFLSAVEDSGYMARAAFVMDKSMRAIGLPGKAFVPLIVGFGCNVPAIMATRTLENERERKLTMLMNPFMSCGARLPVYVLFAAAFFPHNGQNLVFGLYIIGILAAIGTGMLMKKTLLPGISTGFMMELPPYHIPKLKGILLRTWDRLKGFIKDAGKVIIVMVMVINTLSAINMQGRFAHGDTEHSVLGVVSQTATPLFAPMGIHQDNWPAVLGIFTGIMAKEVVVGTLDAIYTQLAQDEAGITAEQEPFRFWQGIKNAIATVPENLADVKDALLDPLGLGSANITTQEAAARDSGVDKAVFGAMVKRFDGQIGAFAYLLFVLLYFPCVATIGAISREAGLRWALFTGFWTTSTAYVVSVLFYQIASWSRHPASSAAWVAALLLYLGVLILALKKWGQKDTAGEIPVRIGA